MLYEKFTNSIFSLEYCKIDIQNRKARLSDPYQLKIYTQLHQKEY